MSYEVKNPVKLPKTRSYKVYIRYFNDEQSMNLGRKCGAVQAGNWPEEGSSAVVGIYIRAKNAVDAMTKFVKNPLKWRNTWDERNEVIAVMECGSGKYEFECVCDRYNDDKFGNDDCVKKVDGVEMTKKEYIRRTSENAAMI